MTHCSPTLVAAVDLGSTGVKVLVADAHGTQLLVQQRPTPWRDGAGGTTFMEADELLRTVNELLAATAEELAADRSIGDASIAAIAISGMGETGVLVDSEGVAAAPAIAWFDPRGGEQIAALPLRIREEFAGRTGLPLGVQVSLAKLLHLQAGGLELAGLRWFNLPEFVAAALGARSASEYSLASRTGLLDQDTGRPWEELMDHLGVDPDFLPPLVDAGTPLGRATATWLPPVFTGAQVTVAGHDHLVSAVSGGAIPGTGYHVSMGTAEVLLRVLDEPLPAVARARLADSLINCVRHVVPGKHVVVAGVKTGLLMRRALLLGGVSDRAGRDRLDELALAQPLAGGLAAGAVEVCGARNDDGVLSLRIRADGVGPPELLNAVLRHGNDEIQLLIDAMDQEIPPARSSMLTGGWAAMRSVQRARAEVLPGLQVSHRDQDTAYGAALFAARLLTPGVTAEAATPTRPPSDPARPSIGVGTMTELTTLERRGMAAISTPDGRMLIVAADQRNGMKAVMNDAPDGPGSITAGQLADAKSDLVRYLGNHAPAILLDPEVALPLVVDDGTLARDTALVVGLDASGFETVDGLRFTRFVEGMNPHVARELGGDVGEDAVVPARRQAAGRLPGGRRDPQPGAGV